MRKDCLENKGLNPEIKTCIQDIISKLKSDGHTVEAVDFPYLDYLVPTYYVLTTAEASSNLARYAGITYGYRSSSLTAGSGISIAEDAVDTGLDSVYKKSR